MLVGLSWRDAPKARWNNRRVYYLHPARIVAEVAFKKYGLLAIHGSVRRPYGSSVLPWLAD